MHSIFQSILPIFALILIGTLSKKLWLKSLEFWRNLERLSYYLLFPTALFNYIYQANFNNNVVFDLVISLMFSTLIVSIVVVYMRRSFNTDNAVFTSFFQGAIRYNSYIFIGVASSLYDLSGLSIVAITSGYMMIFTNILTILVFNYYIKSNEGDQEISLIDNISNIIIKLLTNPLLIACLLGFVANFIELKFSLWINKLLSNLSEAATAIGVMCVGAGLKFKVSTDNMKLAAYACFTKLIILPIITLLSLKLFNVFGVAKSVGILYSALPCAGTSYILSQQLGGDPDSMAFIITLSIIFSLASITLVMFLFG